MATTNYGGNRTYGTSVLLPLTPANNYDPMITIMGGNNPATNTTEIIDMGAATPKWVNGLKMSEQRIELNAVILPNGKILAVGGSVNDEDTGSLSLNADLFDLSTVNLNSSPPNLGTVSSAGANATQRLYHSVALLLPNATVWLAGGNPERGTYNNTMEIYQPPYLFTSSGALATQPSITSAPTPITYGNTFTVQSPDASTISSVVLVRNGTVTHAFGMDQRLVGMSFTAGSGSLTVTAPPNGNIAPPGYYMLFILNSSGVPSVAQMVQVLPTVSTVSVSSVSPNNGSTAGGTAVTITGTSFAAGATVTFGGAAATNVVVVNSTTITATTPAGTAGAVTVTVTVDGQSGSLISGFTYNGIGTISFIQVASATPRSTTTVSATYPAAQTAGDLNIVVVGWNDTTSAVQSVKDGAGNTYSLAIGPTKGTGLQQSIYYAANIVGGTNTVTVTFNQSATDPDVRILEYRGVATLDAKAGASGSSTAANSGSATTTSANELIFGADMVATSTGAAGSGFTSRVITPDGDIAEDKVVTTAGSNSATATLSGSGPWVMQMATFSVVSGAVPTVTSVSPNSGSTAGGTAVTITGTNFATGSTVTFGGTAATNVVVVSGTMITATTPAHAAGAVTVTVTVNGQSGSLISAFTYVAPPTVTSVSPNNGSTAGGTAVTITGTNFASGATVTFGGTAATNVVVVSGTMITATTPAHAAGAVTVTVTVNGQSGSLASGFTYNGTGTISFIQVASATPQTKTTTVSATYPAAQTAGDLNIVVVGWNDTTSTVQSVKDGAGNTYSLAIGPTKGTGLQQSIYYAANIVGGTNTVTVTFNQSANGPDIRILEYRGVATLDAKAGASGSSTAANSGSATTTSANELIFGADMVATSTGAAGTGFTSRIITSPDGDIAEDKVVTTAGSNSATATLSGSGPWVMQMATFSAVSGAVPTVTSVSPNNGSTAGGTAVTITGTNFASGATVTFGGTAATNVVVVSGTMITATTPAHAAGAVTVTVTVNGQSGSLASGFTYNGTGTISFIQVASATPQTKTTTVSATYPAAQTAGDLNIVVVGWNDTTSTVQSVKDGAGNTYSLAIGPTKGTGLQQSIYYAANIVGGTNTVTVTFNQSANGPDIRILEYRGVATLDAKAGASGSSTAANSGSATTTSANELIFGADMVATSTGAAGTGFTSRIITSPDGDIAEDKVVTTAGSNSATATLSGSGPWVMQMVTFK